ncbi:MAG: acyl-CoA dehydrogenase family protein [Planctomycetes bacterium]|nr:acyl-CoA dehydrogenase family protein [Planctomycetota bacterium]
MTIWNDLDEAERAFQDACRTFASEVIAPWAPICDAENRFPREVHEAAYERGLMNVSLPAELGGGGRSFRCLAAGGEELAAVCAPTAFSMGFNHGALRPVLHAGTSEQRQRFVGDVLAARGYSSLCLTEPDSSGSNLFAVETTARKTESGWSLSGTKCMVGNGTEASVFLTLAQTSVGGRPQGVSFFAVPRGEGVEVGENTDKLGFRCVTTPTVVYREVALDEGCLIGGIGEAEQILLETLDFIRFGGASVILGIVLGGMREVIPWVEQRRVVPDDPLVSKSSVQQELGKIYAELQASRLLMMRAADCLDRGEPCSTETATAKYLASELAVRATNSFVQLHGWRGIDGEHGAAKRLRDARATTIYEGTSQIQLMNLFRTLRRNFHADGRI